MKLPGLDCLLLPEEWEVINNALAVSRDGWAYWKILKKMVEILQKSKSTRRAGLQAPRGPTWVTA